MTQTYFLGANSKDGFASLYADFPPRPGAFLHIIKCGPGTGKSSFMRAIGKAAEARALDVHYVLCSGDPDSLDGVYIPALRSAWVDGTAPHVTEPVLFGVDSDYVNLGQFCRLPIAPADAEHIMAVSQKYKALYQHAYAYLSAAADLERADSRQNSPSPILKQQVDTLLQEAAEQAAGQVEALTPRRSSRFLHALSCRGEVRLTTEIEKLCKQIIQLDRAEALAYAAESFPGEVILCPSPLRPELPEAVLLPEASLALVDSSWQIPAARSLTEAAPLTAEQAEARQLKARMLALAFDRLRRAKALHDEMEAVYKRYMDFPALTAYTDTLLNRLFS